MVNPCRRAVPFANSSIKTFGAGAEFEMVGQIVPTSVRLIAQ